MKGTAITCACSDGRAGAQTCQTDGTYGACDCADAPRDVTTCVPGFSATCACNDGHAGAQTCQPDGSFAACACSAATDAGSVASCVPGASATCACGDGRAGAQTCQADGTFAACACSAIPDAGSVSTCVPGSSVTCACTDGSASSQTCQPDGTFGACACSAATDGGAAWDEPSLRNLTVTQGRIDFSPQTLVYGVHVLNDTTVVLVTPTLPTGARATIRVNGLETSSGASVPVTLSGASTSITVQVQTESGATRSYLLVVTAASPVQQASLKASNADPNDQFGYSVALNADGSMLAVGAYSEGSAPDAGAADNSLPNSGAVYVFTRSGTAWVQQAMLKASNADQGDGFGRSVALSDDGSTLAVGATLEASSATGGPADNSAPGSGAVYVFSRLNGVWTETAFLKASNADANDVFGRAVSLSGDGQTLATGAYAEDGSATAGPGDNSAASSGAAYVFVKSGATWTQQAYLKASNAEAGDSLGISLQLSRDGHTLAVGAPSEDSSATGGPADNSLAASGAVYVFTRSGTTWPQQAMLKAPNAGMTDSFGQSVTIDGTGSTVVVGAPGERSDGTSPTDDSATQNGAAYVFTRAGDAWAFDAYLKAGLPDPNLSFGFAMSLSADGRTLAVGAHGQGVGGAMHLFSRTPGAWAPQQSLSQSSPDVNDFYGQSVAVCANGSIVAVTARGEDSSATGGETDNSAQGSGAAYVFGW